MTAYTFGGTSLSTFGRVTLINDDLDIAERRGEDIQLPYLHGRTHVDKFYDARTFTFGIAMQTASEAATETLIDTLKALIAPRGLQALAQTREDSSVRTIQAEVIRPLQIQRIGPYITKLVIEFYAPFPFWTGATLTDVTETIDASPTALAIENLGTIEERNPTIVLTGPLENVTITNTENGLVLVYTGVIDDGDTVTITQAASGEYTAVHSVDGNVIGSVTHSGSTALMVLIVGDNDLTVESDVTTTGTCQITHYPKFL